MMPLSNDYFVRVTDPTSGKNIISITSDGKLELGDGIKEDEALVRLIDGMKPYMKPDVKEFVSMRVLLVDTFNTLQDVENLIAENNSEDSVNKKMDSLMHRLESYFHNYR